jgi:hypothetical protein
LQSSDFKLNGRRKRQKDRCDLYRGPLTLYHLCPAQGLPHLQLSRKICQIDKKSPHQQPRSTLAPLATMALLHADCTVTPIDIAHSWRIQFVLALLFLRAEPHTAYKASSQLPPDPSTLLVCRPNYKFQPLPSHTSKLTTHELSSEIRHLNLRTRSSPLDVSPSFCGVGVASSLRWGRRHPA